MPGRLFHQALGAGAAGLGYLAYKELEAYRKGEQLFGISEKSGSERYLSIAKIISELGIAAGIGWLVGIAPDSLEPSETGGPEHRGFFHSLTFLVILGSINYLLRKRWKPKVKAIVKILDSHLLGGFSVAYISYISHLVADSFTPKGISLIDNILKTRIPEHFTISVPIFFLAITYIKKEDLHRIWRWFLSMIGF